VGERTGGSLWRNEAAWAIRRKKSGCPICRRGRPRDVVAVLRASWVSAPARAPLPGYVAVVSKRHVVEPFELPALTARLLWEDVILVGKALTELLSPIKMNYEIHGNTIPHLHVHVYPRFVDDPFVGGPIDARVTSFARTRDERLQIGDAIRDASIRDRPRRKASR